MENKEWNVENRPEQPKRQPEFSFAASAYDASFYQRNQPSEETPVVAESNLKQPKRVKLWPVIAVCALAVVVSIVATAIWVNAQWEGKNRVFQKTVDDKIAVLQDQLAGINHQGGEGVVAPPAEGAMTPGQVYDRNVQAVVAISNESMRTNIFGEVSRTASSGSGFIVSEDGYVVTNYHVVSGATTLRVITYDSKEHDATLVGYDASNDLAVLKIEAEGLTCAQLGSSDALNVGDQVAAIGNPLGELTSTLTVGYISAKDRTVLGDSGYVNMLQTDAAINSGNSGGPLFNMLGEVIGITTSKYTGTSGSGAIIEGIGFAIPIDDVMGMIEDLMEKGYITSAYLGVMVQDVDPAAAQKYGFPLGVYVESVTEGYCAQKAGIQAKDIIIDLGGHKTETLAELTRVLRDLEPGLSTTVTVFRSGQEVYLEITLDEKPEVLPDQEPEVEQMPQQILPEQGGGEDWSSLFPFFGFGN